MAGLMDFRLLDSDLPAKVAAAPMQGYQNTLASLQNQQMDQRRMRLADLNETALRGQIGDQQLARDEAAAYKSAMSGFDPSNPNYGPLMQASPTRAIELQGKMQALNNSALENKKLRVEATLKNLDLIGRKLSSVQTDDDAMAVINELGGQDQAHAQALTAAYQKSRVEGKAPAQIAQEFGATLSKEVLAKVKLYAPEFTEAGGALVNTNPLAGPVGGMAIPKTNSPDAVLSAQTSRRGQDLSDSRGRELNQITREVGLQEKQLKVDELKAKAEDRKRSKQAGIDSIGVQISVIDKAIAHPGRKTATGLSGTLDPRNYVAGTQATDFQTVLDQISGTAFLQAFESLKGGGQITEVEGKKATQAIARLNRAQSDKEFLSALQDLREVMTTGYKRLSGGEYREQKATEQTGGIKFLGFE